MGKTCKYFATILLALVLIGGLAVASEAESIAVFFYFAVSGFVFFVVIYSLGEIIDLLIDIKNNTNPAPKEAVTAPSSDNRTENDDVVDDSKHKKWFCSHCGCANEYFQIICAKCKKPK